MSINDYFLIAKVGKPHGLKGEFVFHLFSEGVDELAQLPTIYKKENDLFVPLPRLTFKVMGQRIVGKIEGINSQKEIKSLCHLEIYIKKEDLAPLEKGEYYRIDLIGSQCYYQNKKLGIIKNVVNYGTCDLFEIEDTDRHIFYVPFLNQYLKEISLETKSIHFTDLEGFV